jgi:hypothetical protein
MRARSPVASQCSYRAVKSLVAVVVQYVVAGNLSVPLLELAMILR